MGAVKNNPLPPTAKSNDGFVPSSLWINAILGGKVEASSAGVAVEKTVSPFNYRATVTLCYFLIQQVSRCGRGEKELWPATSNLCALNKSPLLFKGPVCWTQWHGAVRLQTHPTECPPSTLPFQRLCWPVLACIGLYWPELAWTDLTCTGLYRERCQLVLPKGCHRQRQHQVALCQGMRISWCVRNTL